MIGYFFRKFTEVALRRQSEGGENGIREVNHKTVEEFRTGRRNI